MERYQTCRMPGCTVHLGWRRPHAFSAANRAEMAQLRAEGWLFREIAADFGTWPSVVANIVRDVEVKGGAEVVALDTHRSQPRRTVRVA